MDRFLPQVRARSRFFLLPTRRLSSFFDYKSRSLPRFVTQTTPSSILSTDFEPNSLFPLPGRVGFQPILKLNSNHVYSQPLPKKSSVDSQMIFKSNPHLEIQAYDCSTGLRAQLQSLFVHEKITSGSLTAITITFQTTSDMSTWSVEVENERTRLTEQFIRLADQICVYLSRKQYWVDFIDPSNGKPYYGAATSDVLFETDERYEHLGMNIVDLGCCRVIEHLQHGTHVFVGCIFTNASRTDSSIQQLLREFVRPDCGKEEC